jgi:D-glycero-alpha-D-manno-heptose 1-phosphate guanylyltransferase
MKAVVLAGGLGTRLRSVTARPKPLAEVGGNPFLQLLISQLRDQGIRRLVLCTGYLADEVEQAMGDGSSMGVSIEYSKESSPLGTGGAVKNAQPFLRDESDFLVMNGDSFLEADFAELIGFHFECGGLIAMAVHRSNNAGRFGSVQVGADGRVTGFTEKTNREEPGMINGGVYVFNQQIFDRIPAGVSSLERDIFPRAVAEGIFATEQRGMFIDIGTPDDYARAQGLFGTPASSRKA